MIYLIYQFLLASASLEWTDYRTPQIFDLTDLQDNSPYMLFMSGYTIHLSIGKPVAMLCGGKTGNVLRLSPTGCEVIGTHLSNITHQIEDGLSITYTSDTKCSNGRAARTTIQLLCASTEYRFQLASSPDACDVLIEKLDPAGCGVTPGLTSTQICL